MASPQDGDRARRRRTTGERGPAMVDVAQLAGVSHQTVSRVLNDDTGVRSLTRQRVLSAIEELGYRRNSAARTLVTGRSQTLGVVTLNSTLYGPASTLYSIEQAALDSQYFVSVASLRSTERTAVRHAMRGDWSPESGFDAGRMLAEMPHVSAVFVANDSMALGVLRAFAEHGRHVPGDVSVVGFDDVPEAPYFRPPLTTVRQDFGESRSTQPGDPS